MNSTPFEGFTGEYRDMVTGAYPLGNGYRSYLPSLMRFAAPDSLSPFGYGGINPYAYCGADPINHTDPSGHFNLGELLGDTGDVVFHRQGQEQEPFRPASTPIPATYAADWKTTHLHQASSPETWEQTRIKSATELQRRWRGYATRRKLIPQQLQALASSMGRKVTEADDYRTLLREGRIIVSSTVRADNTLMGHSSIYHEYDISHIMFTTRARPGEGTTRFPLTKEMANHMNSIRNKVGHFKAGDYAVIYQQLSIAPPQIEFAQGLIKKGRMYVLDEKYSQYYSAAYDQEAKYLSTAPFSYGLQYNCHAFVYGILRRLGDMD